MNVIILFLIAVWVIPAIGAVILYPFRNGEHDFIYQYVVGFLGGLALFQILCTPLALYRISFTHLTILFTSVIGIVTIGGTAIMILDIKKKGILYNRNFPQKRLSLDEKIYLVFFLGLLLFQIYHMITDELGVMSYDDAAYLVQSTAAIEDNGMYLTNEYTGEAEAFNAKRVFNSYPIYIAYLSYISDVPVTIMAHTILAVYLLVLAYFIYYFVAQQLFVQRREQLMFLALLSVLNIFGWYSYYSVTFRLLGPIWQGKSLLMALILPFAFGFMLKIMAEAYSHNNLLIILVMTLAACATSIMGMIMYAIAVGVILLIGIVKEKKRYYVAYASVAGLIVAIHAVGYLVLR